MNLAGTGLDSFTDPADITTLYPFPGLEVALVVISLLLLVSWHFLQMREENEEYDDAIELYSQVGMERAMHFGGVSHLDTAEDMEAVEARVGEGHRPEPGRTAEREARE